MRYCTQKHARSKNTPDHFHTSHIHLPHWEQENYLNLVCTPLNVYFTAFKSIFLCLSMYLLPRMNGMLDFIWMLPIQLRGKRNKWTLQKIFKNFYSTYLRSDTMKTLCRVQRDILKMKIKYFLAYSYVIDTI